MKIYFAGAFGKGRPIQKKREEMILEKCGVKYRLLSYIYITAKNGEQAVSFQIIKQKNEL